MTPHVHMTLPLLATVYPGGALAILSALFWLLFTGLAFITLLIAPLGIWIRHRQRWISKSLKVALWTSGLAICLLIIETAAVGWDAFFVLKSRELFFEQFPANFIRLAINLVSGTIAVIAWKRQR